MFPSFFTSPLPDMARGRVPIPMDATPTYEPGPRLGSNPLGRLPFSVPRARRMPDNSVNRFQPRVSHTFTVHKQPTPDTNFYPGAFLFEHYDPAGMREHQGPYFLRSVSALNHYLFSDASVEEPQTQTTDAADLLKIWSPLGFQRTDPELNYGDTTRAVISVSLSHLSPHVPNIWLSAKPDMKEGDWLWFLVVRRRRVNPDGSAGRSFWCFVPHVQDTARPPAVELYTEIDSAGRVAATGAAVLVGMVHQLYNNTNEEPVTFKDTAASLVFPSNLTQLYQRMARGEMNLPQVEICRLLQ